MTSALEARRASVRFAETAAAAAAAAAAAEYLPACAAAEAAASSSARGGVFSVSMRLKTNGANDDSASRDEAARLDVAWLHLADECASFDAAVAATDSRDERFGRCARRGSINRQSIVAGVLRRSPRGMQLVRADGVHRPRVVRAVARSRARGRRARARRRLRRAGGRRLGPRPTRARARQRGGRCGRVGGGGRRPARGRPRRAPRGGRRVRRAAPRHRARARAPRGRARRQGRTRGPRRALLRRRRRVRPERSERSERSERKRTANRDCGGNLRARGVPRLGGVPARGRVRARKCAERCAECAGAGNSATATYGQSVAGSRACAATRVASFLRASAESADVLGGFGRETFADQIAALETCADRCTDALVDAAFGAYAASCASYERDAHLASFANREASDDEARRLSQTRGGGGGSALFGAPAETLAERITGLRRALRHSDALRVNAATRTVGRLAARRFLRDVVLATRAFSKAGAARFGADVDTLLFVFQRFLRRPAACLAEALEAAALLTLDVREAAKVAAACGAAEAAAAREAEPEPGARRVGTRRGRLRPRRRTRAPPPPRPGRPSACTRWTTPWRSRCFRGASTWARRVVGGEA